MPSNLSDRPVSPLRARMIEAMTVRGVTVKTRQVSNGTQTGPRIGIQ